MGPEHAKGSARIVGRYAVYDEIASGGMASVHLGRLLGPVGFSRTVAIKRLHAQFAKDPDFVSMFLDEARLAARIQHPNVVPTLDVVALAGELFLVMEYIQGESLSRLIRHLSRRGEGISPRIAVAIVGGVLQGLQAAHEAKNERGEPLHIVHRDVSPQNILLGVDGVARVADFGVAKASGRSHQTAEGHVKGKVGYMSPEQLCGEPIDPRTDVYAASAVLWELLAHRRLLKAENAVAAWAQISEKVVPAPSTVAPGAPVALDAIVLKGLSRDKNQRFETALEMADALERAVAPATVRELAAWVKSVAADALEERAARVASIESTSTARVRVPSAATLPDDGAAAIPVDVAEPLMAVDEVALPSGSMSAASNLTVSMRPGALTKRGRIAGALLGAGALLAIGIAAWRWSAAAPPVSSAPSNAASAPEAPSQPAAAPTASASATAFSPPSTPPPPTTTEAAAAKPPTPKQPRPRPAGRNCTPPYTVDPSGLHIPKPECL